MKFIKRGLQVAGVLVLLIGVVVGAIVGKKYYVAYLNDKALDKTVLGEEIEASDFQEALKMKNGKIQSKKLITLSEIPPLWQKVSEDDTLKAQFKHLENINFYLMEIGRASCRERVCMFV